ncbi:MAG: penicillin-binding protein 2 [Flavobacteriaceae bacterium]|nr:penicillin-binding protein 2 [Flavobacteriaceae bacterium]MCY4215556.1 penicillin-binding protein 2 [Flavobacteriaceae bacterium]MCY4253336.1 penicillin-binding protein 2 [Flavobacteriaceae bacterium]
MNFEKINLRLYLVTSFLFLAMLLLIGKLVYIQWVEDNTLVEIPKQVVRNVILEPDRGDIYSSDGKILATSVYTYEIRWDSKSPSKKLFETYKVELSKKLSEILQQNPQDVLSKMESARQLENRYLLIAKKVDHHTMKKIKELPIFNRGEISGGLIVERKVERKLPLDKYAARTIGYEKQQPTGAFIKTGIEGGYSQYLRGEVGFRLKKRIASGVWKPISDSEYRKPIPGGNLYTTIDSHIQKTTHEALDQQLKKFEASYGTAVVMEVKTGQIKAIVNLTRNQDNTYSEKYNYALANAYEPGSTFKTFALMVAMEDKKITPQTKVNVGNGQLSFFNKHTIRDSKRPKSPQLTVSRILETSSNVGVVKLVNDLYGEEPEKFLRRLSSIGIDKPLELDILGEPNPYIPTPKDQLWSKISLPWMSYGYGLSLTPLQLLTFYNGIANDGQVVKPQFVKSVSRSGQESKIEFEKQIINPSMASKSTIESMQQMLKDVVEKPWGTGHNIYSSTIPIAGKTGTSQENYNTDNMNYVASFVGYFPVDQPQYSMITVVFNPNAKKGYYATRVAAPVVQKVASKIIPAIPEEIFLNRRQITSVINMNEVQEPIITPLTIEAQPTSQETVDVVAAGQVSVESGREAVDKATNFINEVGQKLGFKVVPTVNRKDKIVLFENQ